MPCTQTGSIAGDMALSLQEARKAATAATGAACEALKALEKYMHQNSAWEEEESVVKFLSKETRAWWKRHQEIDEECERRSIKLTRKESERLVKALRNPKKPTKALIKGIKRYRKAIKTGKIVSR